MRKITIIISAILGMASCPAAAQGVFDLGALAKTVAAGPSTGGGQGGQGGQVAPPPSTATLAKLSFAPSPVVRKQVIADFVKNMKAVNPEAGAQMEVGFAQTDIIGEISKALTPYGMKTDNMADAYAFYLITAWMGANGRTDDMTNAQITGVQKMAQAALGGSKELMALDDGKKQLFAESLLLQGMMNDAMTEAVATDPAMKFKVMGDLKAAAKELGIDTDAFILTPAGLVRK